MEKIKPRSQMQEESTIDLVRKEYDIETINRICAANRYIIKHKEDLLKYVLNNICTRVRIVPQSFYIAGRMRNEIVISFINNDLFDIANNFIGLEYSDDEFDYAIDPYTKFICEAVYEYIMSVNDMLIKTLQIKSVEFNYVSRKVLITPMDSDRLKYYETLLETIISDTYTAIDIEEIVHSIFG